MNRLLLGANCKQTKLKNKAKLKDIHYRSSTVLFQFFLYLMIGLPDGEISLSDAATHIIFFYSTLLTLTLQI